MNPCRGGGGGEEEEEEQGHLGFASRAGETEVNSGSTALSQNIDFPRSSSLKGERISFVKLI